MRAHIENMPIRWILRDATAALHAELDEKLGALDLTSHEQYSAFLNVHAVALSQIAVGLVPGPLASGIDALIRAARQDLGLLGAISAEPPFQSRGLLHPLGVAYVIGGSHFGKKILRRRHAAARDPRVLAASAFFDETSSEQIWNSAPELLQPVAADQSLDGPISSALDVFAVFLAASTQIRTSNGPNNPQFSQFELSAT